MANKSLHPKLHVITRGVSMKSFNGMTRLGAATALLLAIGASPGYAAADVTLTEAQAVVQTLGFLSNLPNGGTFNVGVVYSQDVAGNDARAEQVATMLGTIRGPNQRAIHATAIAVKDLAQAPQPFDAYLLMPGTAGQGAAINDVVRRRHIISISTDPACLDANCCVLMVSQQARVRIVLDTALADAVGAKFSSVFAMMVTRK